MTRPRPHVHFTAESGWINDPYGIAWIGDRYHLYYQAVPGSVTWSANCHWGHAQSLDLVRWVEQPVALAPQAFEVGCWSGSVVQEADPPTIFYTRVVSPEDIDMGQVAVARLMRRVRPGARPETTWWLRGRRLSWIRLFRPDVVRTTWGWRMYVAAAWATAARPRSTAPQPADLVVAGVVCTRADAEVLGECRICSARGSLGADRLGR